MAGPNDVSYGKFGEPIVINQAISGMRGLHVDVGGTVTFNWADDGPSAATSTITVLAGMLYPYSFRKVTGGTASGLTAIK